MRYFYATDFFLQGFLSSLSTHTHTHVQVLWQTEDKLAVNKKQEGWNTF